MSSIEVAGTRAPILAVYPTQANFKYPRYPEQSSRAGDHRLRNASE